MNDLQINLTECIGPAYYEVFHDLEQDRHFQYWFAGGRGSLKSSFVFIYVIYKMTMDALNGESTHCVALRKIKDTIKDSIFVNLLWAIDLLGLSGHWKYTVTPMKLQFRDSTILFRGCANKHDYEKIKSIKVRKGYIKHGIFEELTEYDGIDEIYSIYQSLFRGGKNCKAYLMYNPPPSKNNWTNHEFRVEMPNKFTHKSTYLQAPREWLDDTFLELAENIKTINRRKYNHMYLAEEIGEGLEIYPAKDKLTGEGVLTLRTITDEEISKFTQISRGLDFGYSHASCYSESYYDTKTDKLYVFNEVYGVKLSNKTLYERIYLKAGNAYIRGDNEDPRTINELKNMGLNVGAAKKGPDSKPHGIKWLQDRCEIIVDKQRCPNIAEDLLTYEYKKDKEDKIIYEYPDEPDGSASIRYGQEENILSNRWGWKVKK